MPMMNIQNLYVKEILGGKSETDMYTELCLSRSWGEGVDCGVHPYKHSWIFQKRPRERIWDFLAFNIYYLGPFSQTFRSVSLFLLKLEPFCRGWLQKFCLIAKIQHFLPYRYLTFCQTKYTMDAVLLCQQDLW